MKKVIITFIIFLVIGAGSLSLAAPYAMANSRSLPAAPCVELWNNCVATAIEDFVNGTSTFEEFYMFYENICPGAYGNCAGMN